MSGNVEEILTHPVAVQNMARPLTWSRYISRSVDAFWEMSALEYCAAYAIATFDPNFRTWITRPRNEWIFMIGVFPFVFLLDALIYGIFKNTPSKALNGIRVTTASGTRLTFAEYLSRNFAVWFSGFGLGIPIVTIFTALAQYRRLVAGKPASYDEKMEYQVIRSNPGIIQTTVFTLFVVFSVGFWIYLCETGQRITDDQLIHSAQKSVPTTTTPVPTSYVWLNPVSNLSTNVDTFWSASKTTNDDKETLYEFTDPTNNKAVVIFGEETMPNSSLSDYLNAFRSATAKQMAFFDNGILGQLNGNPSWVGTGRMAGTSPLNLKVTIVQYGRNFWRVVAIVDPSSVDSAGEVAKLQQALFSTAN